MHRQFSMPIVITILLLGHLGLKNKSQAGCRDKQKA